MLDHQLEVFHQHLAVEKGLAENTLSAYMGDLQRFVAYVHGLDGDARLDRTLITNYLSQRREEGISARTTARELVAIKGLCQFLGDKSL